MNPTDTLLTETRSLFETLHRYPELSWHERETAQRVRGFLERHGAPVTRAKVEPGLLVDIEGGRPGERIFLRADLDALPIQEQTDLPYMSMVAGAMHACGHDFHSSTQCAAAALLWENRQNLAGSFRLAFQPSEEAHPSGAQAMVEAGDADGCDAFLALHVDPHLETGKIQFRGDAMNAAVDTLTITVKGRGGHSSRPHLALDPVRVAALLVTELHQLTGHVTAAHEHAVLAITIFQAGDAFNIIPPEATIKGSLRTASNEARERLIEAIRRTAEHVTAAAGVTHEIDMQKGHPPVINDVEMTRVARDAIREDVGPDVFREMPRPTMGGDDFSQFGVKGPQLLMRLGTHGGGEMEDLHSPRFCADPAALPLAVRIVTAVAARLAAS